MKVNTIMDSDSTLLFLHNTKSPILFQRVSIRHSRDNFMGGGCFTGSNYS